jgi:hypothetical protein
MTPERMAMMRRNGWLPREPARTDPRPSLDVMTPWLPPWKPEEGPVVSCSLDGLTGELAALGEARDDVIAIAHQANQAGYPISLKQLPSERRYYIAKGLITLFRACADAPLPATTATQVDDLARCFVAHIADDEGAQQPGIPLGAVVGSLDATAAKAFCELAEAFEAGLLALTFTTGGRMYLPEDPDQPTPAQETEDMDLNELAPPAGTPIDFELGDTYEGTLEDVGEWRPITTEYGVKDKCPWVLDIDGNHRTIWVAKGSRLARVLGDALRDAGARSTDEAIGGRLKVRRIEDKDVGKGKQMHDFVAKFTPNAKAAAKAADLEDF